MTRSHFQTHAVGLIRAGLLSGEAANGLGDQLADLAVLAGATFDPEPPPEAPPRTLDDIARQAILETMQRTGGNRLRAAQQLGINRRTLQRKLKEYGEESHA